LTRLVLPLLALALASALPAGAHSLLLDSDPKADAAVAASPRQLRLRFNNRIEKRLCRLRLLDARGTARTLAVDLDDSQVDQLRAALPALAPGSYRVEWQVLSADGHIVSGFFKFRVVP
jgi:methionine-rich copper-binding protein CopC